MEQHGVVANSPITLSACSRAGRLAGWQARRLVGSQRSRRGREICIVHTKFTPSSLCQCPPSLLYCACHPAVSCTTAPEYTTLVIPFTHEPLEICRIFTYLSTRPTDLLEIKVACDLLFHPRWARIELCPPSFTFLFSIERWLKTRRASMPWDRPSHVLRQN